MARCILFCEGSNDTIFFDEYLKQFSRTCISEHNKLGKSLDCYDIVITPCCGTYIHRIYSKLIRQLIYTTISIFSIIIDSDKFNKSNIVSNIKNAFNNMYNNRFKPNFDLDQDTCILNMKSERRNHSVIIFETPNTLEINIHNAYKKKYTNDDKLNTIQDSHEAIEYIAERYFNGNKERAIRYSVNLLKSEQWIDDLHYRLRTCNIL